jgi:hypothetical protein
MRKATTEKQKFQLGDTAYMIDEDFRCFESEVYRIVYLMENIIILAIVTLRIMILEIGYSHQNYIEKYI